MRGALVVIHCNNCYLGRLEFRLAVKLAVFPRPPSISGGLSVSSMTVCALTCWFVCSESLARNAGFTAGR